MPVVTICLPIYNAERFLAEAISSLRAQTFGDFEVIAILDGCTDHSEEILLDSKDERFAVVKFEQNRGVVAASNLAIERARGVYGGRMDADDISEPTRLEKQVAFLNEHPDVDVVGTWFDYIGERGKRIRPAFSFPATHEELVESFRIRNSIGGCAVMFRNERIRALGGYPEGLPQTEDLALWLRCLASGYRLANIPEVLVHYRQHVTQASHARRVEMYRLTNLAYKTYGPLIWGDRAPQWELGAPLWKRALRKIRRMTHGR
jgi:glycosyltransferase involved in cell wall biosynthesis